MAGPVHAVDEQDVLPAVGVVVEERAAGAHRLGQELAAVGAVAVPELQAGTRRDVDEAHTRICLATAASSHAGMRHRVNAPAPQRADELAPIHSGPTSPCRSA